MKAFIYFLLLFFLIACKVADPVSTSLEIKATGNKNLYSVRLKPRVTKIEIDQLHQWDLWISSIHGDAISNAEVHVDGGMPQHNHGLPSQPQVVSESKPGQYVINGMEFSMPGQWEIKLSIKGAYGTDEIVVTTTVSLPPIEASK